MDEGASQPAIAREPVVSDLPRVIDGGAGSSAGPVRTSGSGWRIVVGVVFLLAIAGAAAFALKTRDAPTGERAPAATPGAPVAIAAVQTGEMMARRRYPGEVFSDAVDLSSRVSGHVDSIEVRIGDEVKAGQVIAQIDDALIERRLVETRAQISAQKSQLKAAAIAAKASERDLERLSGLLDKGAVSTQEVDDLRTALDQRSAAKGVAQSQLDEAQARLAILREDLKDTKIAAPFDGVIARRDVDPGAFVEPGTPLVRIVAQRPLRVRFRVPEHEFVDIHEGIRFSVHTRASGDRVPEGEVKRISGEVSPEDRAVLVEGLVDEDEALRSGMYVDIELQMRQLSGALIVPDAAVVERIEADGTGRVGVFVLEGDTARWCDVLVLAREGGRVAIEAADGAADPKAGSSVFVRGHRELQDGAQVRVVDGDGAAEASP